MKTRKIQLTAEHVKRAIKANDFDKKEPTECCPVFQALNDAGLNPRIIGYSYWYNAETGHSFRLLESAQMVAHVLISQWHTIQPQEIEVEVP